MRKSAHQQQRTRLSAVWLVCLLTLLPLSNCGTDQSAPDATATGLPQVALGLIEEAVAGRNPTDWPFSDAVAWVRRELPDLCVAAWASQLPGDTALPPERARELWDARAHGAWTTASHGSGSYIVTPT
jgi:hypothetical protein